MNEGKTKFRTPFFPVYSTVRRLMKITDGVMKADLIGMMNAIFEQTGTPKNPVDWSEPDTWIKERLKGDHAVLARRIWEESSGSINPRHIYRHYLFISGYSLLVPDQTGA